MRVKVVDWGAQPGARPDDDVDSFIRREGPDAFQRLIDSAKPAGEWRITHEERRMSPAAEAEERSAVVQRLLAVIRAETDPVMRAHYRRRVAAIGQVDEMAMAKMVGDRLYQKPRPRGGVTL